MSDTVLDRFFAIERAKYGKGQYYFKPATLGSKLRAFYIRPFCPKYIEQFSTALYPDTHFAKKKKDNPLSCLNTEFHENVHKFDRWHQGFKFTLRYLFPQLYAFPFMFAAVALGGLWSWVSFGALFALFHIGLIILSVSASRREEGVPTRGANITFYILTGAGFLACVGATIHGGGYWATLWCGALLFFSPWPLKSIWRRDAELRGYTMSLYRIWLAHKYDMNDNLWVANVERYVNRFTGPNYFFMETNADCVRKELMFQVLRFIKNEQRFLGAWAWKNKKDSISPCDADPFRMAFKFMQQEGMVSIKR